jgi:hypothetical protein
MTCVMQHPAFAVESGVRHGTTHSGIAHLVMWIQHDTYATSQAWLPGVSGASRQHVLPGTSHTATYSICGQRYICIRALMCMEPVAHDSHRYFFLPLVPLMLRPSSAQ